MASGLTVRPATGTPASPAQLGCDQRAERAAAGELVASGRAGTLLRPAIPAVLADEARERWMLFYEQLEHSQQVGVAKLALRQWPERLSIAGGGEPSLTRRGLLELPYPQPAMRL